MAGRARATLVVMLLLSTRLFALPVAGGVYETRQAKCSCLVDGPQPPSDGSEPSRPDRTKRPALLSLRR